MPSPSFISNFPREGRPASWASVLIAGGNTDVSRTDALSALITRYTGEDISVLGADLEDPITLAAFGETPTPAESTETIFEISSPGDGPTRIRVHYRAELFHPDTAAQWAHHLLALLENGTDAEILTADERDAALANSGDIGTRLPDDTTFPSLFESQAQATPDAPAIWCAGTTWTYEELNRFANRLAHHLASMGVARGDRVGVQLERRPEFLGTLLGVMKAGAGYVPLEPDLPEARREFMVEDAEVGVIIDAGVLAVLQDGEYPDTPPKIDLTSEDLAYVIYTSGSTGQPKGVEIPHKSFCDFCLVMNSTYGLSQGHTWLAITTIAFDASIMELFPLLLCGGRVALAPPKLGSDGGALSALIAETGATHLWATPTTLRILAASGWHGNPALTIFSGGEVVDRDIAETTLPLCARLINGYGPTETTVFATNHTITPGSGPVPLGRPMANTTIYLLDDTGCPVPPLARGRLWIGGRGLAIGYLGREELTAEKFVPDPFSEEPGARMYDSGDVAYWDRHGLIHYLGRSDHQVKIRGYRIELGEIEARLAAHPDVRDAAVIVREDNPGEQRLVAYIVPEGEGVQDEVLQEYIATTMPEYMVPGWFVSMQSFPVTTGLKLDRRALPIPPEEESGSTSSDATDLPSQIASLWARVLGRRRIGVDDEVFRLGANSLNAVRLQLLLDTELGKKVPISQVFQHATPTALAHHIDGVKNKTYITTKKSADSPVAVIGMACRFPGAPDIDAYWDLIAGGREAIQTFSPEELAEAGVPVSESGHPDYVPRGSVLDGALDFDPAFFGVSQHDAAVLSPQFRIFLTTVWQALEHAGYPGEPPGESIGVFAGSGDPSYLYPTRDLTEPERLQTLVGNGADFLCTRTAYALGLTGPAVSVQTACSTSLVAIAEAVHAIRAGRCSMSLAGGVSFSWPHAQGYRAGEGLIYSKQGHCRPFDSRADGTLFSQGAGVVLLKPLDQAQADGDTIHAVIKGIATNNDGNRKASYAAPSIEGQCDVIRAAIADADVSARDIGYVEAHGTATKVGDPIEIAGLTAAYRDHTADSRFCAIGSVKGNIGHADAAAGVAGFLKIVLALKNRALPPSLHYEKPNPEIAFGETPFKVQTSLEDWGSDSTRTAGLSAFGMGGTNAHAIVQEYTHTPTKESNSAPWHLLPLSAHTPEALAATTKRFAPHPDLAATAFTLQQGRKHFSHRAFSVADPTPGTFHTVSAPAFSREPIFLFTGQGAQYLRMGEALYEAEPVFREALDECDRLLPDGLLSWLFPKEGAENINIHQTHFTQPALFSIMWAQAALWKSWGVTPTAMVGHSIGEYVAATVAGVFTLPDALKTVSLRSKLMQSMEPGAMLGVPADSKQIARLLDKHPLLDLAVENAPDLQVLAGPHEAIAAATAALEEKGISARPLKTSHAFHSRMMEPLLEEFISAISGIPLSAPTIPYGSNVTGEMITSGQATDPQYYADQISGTVRFSKNIATLLEQDTDKLFIELGPGTILTGLTSRQLGGTSHAAIPTLPGPRDHPTARYTREALGNAWAHGLEIPWPHAPAQKRVPLPTTAFDEQTFAKPGTEKEESHKPSTPLYHVPTWKEEPLPPLPIPSTPTNPWLLFSRGTLHDRLDFASSDPFIAGAIKVRSGDVYKKHGPRRYTIRPGSPEDYQTLIDTIIGEHGVPGGIIHAWSLGIHRPTKDSESFWSRIDHTAASLTWIAQAFSAHPLAGAVPFNIFTTGIHGRTLIPENHTLTATAAVIQKEVPGLATKVLQPGFRRPDSLGALLGDPSHHPFLAFSQSRWLSRTYTPTALPQESPIGRPLLKTHGSLLISGGLGGLALATAEFLAERYPGTTFFLLARTSSPDTPERIAAVERLRTLGCTAHVLEADLAKPASIKNAIHRARALSKDGAIDGVIHTAGSLEDGAIASKDPATFRRVLAAKALGAHTLARALAEGETPPRFFVFFSSIASDLGLFGQVDYSAANAYLDGLAATLHRSGTPAYSLNWPAFRDVGMAAKTASSVNTISPDTSGIDLAAELAQNSLSPAEAGPAILGVLAAAEHPRVTISPLPFRDRQEAATEDGRSSVPHTPTNSKLAATKDPAEHMLSLWRTQLQNPTLDPADNYFDHGGDSLTAVTLTSKIEQAFGTPVPISYLLGTPTVEGLVAKLGLTGAAAQASDLPPHLHLLSPGSEGKPPLILIHGADGGILFYRAFAKALGTGNPIYAIEAPMLHDLEASAPATLEEVATNYLETIVSHVPAGPVIIAGYSLGGIVAYDLAQQLQAPDVTHPVEKLILIDTPNPALETNYHTKFGRLKVFWNNLDEGTPIQKVCMLGERILSGTNTRIQHELELRRAAKIETSEPAATHDSMAGVPLRHVQCREQHTPLEDVYVPDAYPGVLHVLITDHIGDKFTYAKNLGWSYLASPLKTHTITGPHLQLFEPPYLATLLEATREILD